jgi:hypothetical protein
MGLLYVSNTNANISHHLITTSSPSYRLNPNPLPFSRAAVDIMNLKIPQTIQRPAWLAKKIPVAKQIKIICLLHT